MADVRIDYTLNDTEHLSIDLHADSERPDMLDDLTSRGRYLFVELLADVYRITTEPKSERKAK